MAPGKRQAASPPEGFRYQAELLPAAEEQALLVHIGELPLKEFEFHGYTGRRRVLSFGLHYDFGTERLRPAGEIPAFLSRVQERAAAFAGLAAADLPHALVTEYSPGTTIGWHRDKGVFDLVIGLSLLSPCTFRFRRKSGPAWEHSVAPVEALRYSITFRSLRGGLRVP